MEGAIASQINEAVDGLGRLNHTVRYATYQGAASQATTTRTYDALGRLQSVTNPDRAAAGALTTYTYDELDRITDILYPDSSHQRTCYTDNVATIVDPASKWSSRKTDALGRLVQVLEDPTATCNAVNHTGANISTLYTYDGRGNLLTVNQAGRNRAFTYDQLCHLLTATSPESGPSVAEAASQDQSGTIGYQYDPAGNLTQRTDPRNISTTMLYDLMARPVQKSYSDNTTPLVTYCYDGNISGNCAGALTTPSANLNGYLTRVKTSLGGTDLTRTDYTNFDDMGRVLRSEQKFGGGAPYTFQYTYIDIGLKTMQYPSGRVLTYGYDAGGRVAAASGQMGTQQTSYVSAVDYTVWNAVENMTVGAGHWEQSCYNNRLQPVSIWLRT